MRNILLTAAAALVLSTAGASAASWNNDAYGRPLAQVSQSFGTPQSNVSYGVGFNGAGTATGGPVGGLSSRN